MWKKIDSPASEGSPVVTRYNYATGQYMRPTQYGDEMSNYQGLDTQPDNRQTRMGNKVVNAKSPNQPNYMIGNGNSPMDRGGANMFPSQIQGYQYLTSGGYPPESAMPQNANIYPAMFDHQTGQRIDPQSNNGLIQPIFKDKHSTDNEVGQAMFSGLPEYLRPRQDLGSTIGFKDVNGKGGYKYRLFSDGRLTVLSHNGIPKNINVTKGSSIYNAIIGEVGTYQQNSGSAPIQTGNQQADRLIAQGQQFAQSEQGQSLLTSLFDRLISTQGAKTEQQKLLAQQAQLQQQEIQKQMQPSAFQKALPYVGVAVGLVAFGGVVYYVTQPKKK